jgi:hypothetical protein
MTQIFSSCSLNGAEPLAICGLHNAIFDPPVPGGVSEVDGRLDVDVGLYVGMDKAVVLIPDGLPNAFVLAEVPKNRFSVSNSQNEVETVVSTRLGLCSLTSARCGGFQDIHLRVLL